MKKQVASFLFLFFFSALMHAQVTTYSDSWGQQGFSLEKVNTSSVIVNFSVQQFQLDDITVDGAPMKAVHTPGIFLPNNAGSPDLPGTGRYIAMPEGAKPTFKVISYRTETIKNVEVAPAPVIPKDNDRSPMVYKKDMNVYSADKFYPENPVKLSGKYDVRGVDAVILGITPFQYNPVTKELLVYKDIKVEVSFEGGNGTYGENRLRSRWWDPLLRDILINYKSLPVMDYTNYNSKSKSLDQDFEYIIITPNRPEYLAWADSIKKFRTEQGIKTGIVTLSDIGGNTTTAIETYINNAYNTWAVPPAAVLLLADYGTGSATDNGIVSPVYDSYCISDHIYADVNNDNMAEIAFARIVAQNESQLSTMVGKFLNYERNPPTDPNFYDKPITAMGWQTERWFQLCSEIVNGFWEHKLNKHPVRENAIYQGTPGTVWSSATNTSTVVNYFGPSGLNYIPANTAHLTDWGGSAARINADINAGAFMVQHRDHGGEDGWGEPAYTNTNVAQLNNTLLPFVLSINCLTGKFNYSSECFAEAFHRSTKGALGLIAATEVSYSFVNDAYLWGMFDNMWPDFMPAYGDPGPVAVMPAFGNVAGKYFLQQSSWPYNTENKEVTYYLFHHHSDPFLSVYSEVPQNLTVSHNAVQLSGVTTFTITANENSLIGLSVDGELIGSATGTGAPVNITIPQLLPGNVILVTVTKQNYYRYSSPVQVIPPAGAYILYKSVQVNDSTSGNQNGLLDYGESVKLNMGLQNVGTENAAGVSVKLRTSDPYVTLQDSIETVGNINANQIITAPNAFQFAVDGSVPDKHNINFTLVATNGAETWESYFTVMAHAPNLSYVSYTITGDGNNNGRLDPGETVNMNVSLKNSGTSKAQNVSGILSTTNEYVTVPTSTVQYGELDTNQVVQKTFVVSAVDNTPTGTNVIFRLLANSDPALVDTFAFNLVAGQIPVLIVDLDGNSSSAPKILEAVQHNGITAQTVTALPADLSLYTSIFVCLGIYSSNHALAAADGQLLADYLNAGGRLYMEGGDTWYYDTQTAVHPMFNIHATDDGSSNLATLQGQTGSIAEGLAFAYGGENNYIDHIAPVSPAVLMFNNSSPSYGCAVSYNGGTYKTIGTSFEFGGLTDAASPSVKDSLMKRILDFFGVIATPVELTAFNASVNENNITLNWQTATETNNSGFEVEKSTDNKAYTKIGTVKGKGTTTEKQSYTFTDKSLTGKGKMYYRLKQVDFNGTAAYSQIVEVDYSAIPVVFSLSQNYPNPFNPATTINFALPKDVNVSLIVYDALGREVETLVNGAMEAGYHKLEWNASRYASGIYFYRINAGSFTSVKKMMILK